MKKTVIGLTVGGGFVIILGAVLGWVVLPDVVNHIVRKETQIRDGTLIHAVWKETPVPIFMKYWFFHVQNPLEVAEGKKPVLEEKGPYVYRESRKKFDIRQGEYNDLIKYKELKTFIFDEEESNGLKESDEITTVNILYAAIAKILEDALADVNPSVADFVYNFLNDRLTAAGEGLVMKHTVGEMLYHGWDITNYLQIASELCESPLVSPICTNLGVENILEDLNAHPYFGLFSTKNNTDEGEFVVGTGHSNSRYSGEVWTWKGNPSLSYWDKPWPENDYCNMLNGTDGTVFRPYIDEKDILYIYQTDLCRSVFLEYNRDVEYKGIPVKRFVLSPNVGEHPSVFKDNICFCEDIHNVSTCLRAPALPLDKCLYGAPVVGSTAHFFDGDGYYLSTVDGISSPNKSHQTFADIEPLTGAPFFIAKRVQINLDVQKYDGFTGFENITNRIIFPILWFEESAGLTDEYIEAFRGTVVIPIQAIEGVRWTLISLGIVLILMSVIIFMRKRFC